MKRIRIMKGIISEKGRRQFLILFSAAACLCMLASPVGNTIQKRTKGIYTISINGEKLGAIRTKEKAEEVLNSAKQKICRESDNSVLTDVVFKIEKKKSGESVHKYSKSKLTKKVYENLRGNQEYLVKQAFTMKINDFAVSVSSKQEVYDILAEIQSEYDESNQYEIVLKDNAEGAISSMNADIQKKKSEQAKQFVHVVNADSNSSNEQDDKKHLVDLQFAEKIQVIETFVENNEILDMQTALDEVTKEKEKDTIYEVVDGDCISIVAEKNNATTNEILTNNPNLSVDTYIFPGDEIVVKVPKPEISVVVKEEASYEERYESDIVYVDNPNVLVGNDTVIEKGKPGKRLVKALIHSINGTEVDREILEEQIIVESIPQRIERGTKVPPSYIRPLSGGSFSSGFGARWGRTHEGWDWSCSKGTAIRASRGGTVSSAGWSGGYGNCIVINHGDGVSTRYAHLSSIQVSPGQFVNQGDKIALSGNTGNSTGPHLHFEILVGGIAVDPGQYLD